jgi:plastocyanin
MNFNSQLIQKYWIYLALILLIGYYIYRLQTQDYYTGIEYFQIQNQLSEMGIQSTIKPPVIINIKDIEFNPNQIIIPVGTEVKWTNTDSGDTISRSNRVHSIVETRHGLFHSPDLLINDSFRYKFTLPGTYPFYSRQYPNAKGMIIVKSD